MSVKAVRHIGIVVIDMAASVEFYRDRLGLEVWADFEDHSPYLAAVTELPGAHARMVKLQAPNGVSIELLQYLSHPPAPSPAARACDRGCNHVSLEVDDIDSLHEALSRQGVRFHTPPTVSPDGGAKVTYCRDPEGNIVELVELLDREGQ